MSGLPVAVVTGGAQGIGLGIVRHFLAAGYAVGIMDLDAAVGEAVAKQLGPDGEVRSVGCDIGSPQQIEAGVDALTGWLGAPSVLVSNAGWSPYKRFIDTSPEETERIIAVNYTGPLHLCRAVLPNMIEAGNGRIVFVGSDAGRIGTAKEAVYAGAKAALAGFAKSLALEVAATGVTVNVVSPGSTDTALLRSLANEEQLQKRIRGNPMKRLGTPEDVAAAVGYFCSPGAAYVTGQILSVNGGMSRVG